MFRFLLASMCLFGGWSIPVFAQGIAVAGSGYSNPTVVKVAPGQIATFFVTGLKTVLPSGSVSAPSVPLPPALAGISVTLNQPGPKSYTAPLLSVTQISVCVGGGSSAASSSSPTADCLVTAITVQIPFELPYLDPVGAPIDTALVVSENGTAGKGFRVLPMMDNMHILNTCDSFPPVSSAAVSCQPLATHGNGTLVTASSPAKAGEVVVIYAFGMGKPQIPVETGAATPRPAGIGFPEFGDLLFDLSTNAGPKNPQHPAALGSVILGPDYIGLVVGYVGLYQINVTIPKDLVTPFACGDTDVQSNLTIDFGEVSSFDGAPICIEATR